MKSQYPYSLQVLPKQEVIKDENGDFIDVEAMWKTHAQCRDEAGRNYKVNSPDGVGYVATVMIFAPKGTEIIEPGTTIRVMDGDICRATGKVIISRKEYFHTRIWV